MNFDEWYQHNKKDLADNFFACKLSWYSSRGHISVTELKQMLHSALRHRPAEQLSDNEQQILRLLDNESEK